MNPASALTGDGYNGGMHRLCHRCHAELPGAGTPSGNGHYPSDEDHALFCARCGAPQILLPEYLRAEVAGASLAATTGAVPPPRPQMVDWPVAIACMLPIAVATAVFAVAALVNAAAVLLTALCVLSGASVALGLYRTRRPLARVDGRVGLRFGLITGLLMISLIWIGMSATGMIERFVVHGMSGFDDALAKAQVAQQQAGMAMAEQMMGAKVEDAERQKQLAEMASPEFRAGTLLAGVFLQSGILLGLTTAAGGFAGILQTRRGLRSGN